jgi:hypothetical protein
VGRSHGLELEVAQSRAYVHSDYLFVSLEGSWPNCIGHAVYQPPIQMLAELEVIRVEEGASGCIAPRLGELLLDLLVLPAVDQLALRTVRGVDSVPGHVPAILALGDPVSRCRHLFSLHQFSWLHA